MLYKIYTLRSKADKLLWCTPHSRSADPANELYPQTYTDLIRTTFWEVPLKM